MQDNIWALVYSVAYGGVIGLFYDTLRVLRLAFKPGPVLVFFQDIMFWLLSALVTFVYIFVFADGNVRLVFLLAIALGWFMYYISLGKLVFWCFGKILAPIKALFCKFSAVIMRPFLPLKVKFRENCAIFKKNLKKRAKNSIFLFHFRKKNNKIYKDKYSYALKRRR